MAIMVFFIISILFSIFDLAIAVPEFLNLNSKFRFKGQGLLTLAFIISVIGSVVSLVITTVIVARIIQRNPRFFTLLFILLLVELVVAILCTMLFAGILNYTTFVFRLVRDLLIIGYFIKSVRVRTYMGTDEYLTKGLFSPLIKRLFTLPVAVESHCIIYPGWFPAPDEPGYVCWWDGRVWVPESKRPQEMLRML